MMKHSENEWIPADQELDIPMELLESVFEEMPPENVVSTVNPSSVGMKRIITGIALSCITLHLLALDYILPAIGTILLLLGFRNLHRENPWFGLAYFCAIGRFVLLFPQWIMNATIYVEYLQGNVGRFLTIGVCGMQMIMLFSFWMACSKVQEKAKMDKKSFSAGALFLWYSLLLLLGVMNAAGVIVSIIMIIAFIMILKCLADLSRAMETSGYVIQAAAVKVSDGILVKAILGMLTVGIVCGYVCFSTYPMNWTPVDKVQANDNEIYDHLLALGYPKEQLKDLSLEDLELLKDADCLVVKKDELPLNNGSEKTEYQDGTTYITTEYAEKELNMTHVAVRIAGDGARGERWRVIHHFSLDDELKVRGTSNIHLWPLESLDGWEGTWDLSGRLFCKEKGRELTADFMSIQKEPYTSTDFFGESHLNNDCMCNFSLPSKGTDRRGYVAYSSEQIEDGYMLNAWFNYTHQVGYFQYPVKTAEAYVKEGMHMTDYPFRTAQSAIQFYIKDGVPDLSDGL